MSPRNFVVALNRVSSSFPLVAECNVQSAAWRNNSSLRNGDDWGSRRALTFRLSPQAHRPAVLTCEVYLPKIRSRCRRCYFPTKDDIFNALAEDGLQLLRARETKTSCPLGTPPLERLRYVIAGVFDFAKMYPEYFYLLFLDRSTPRLKYESLRAFGEPMQPHIREILDDCIEAGELERGLDAWSVYNVIWTSMAGVASQYVCNRLPPVDPDNYARVIADLVIAGLKAGALNGVQVFDKGTRTSVSPKRSQRPGCPTPGRTASANRRRASGR